jgi:hypothetical protein
VWKLTDFYVEVNGKDFNVYLTEKQALGAIATLPTIELAAKFVRALVDERL